MSGIVAFGFSLILLAIGSPSINSQLLPFRSEDNAKGWKVPKLQNLKVLKISENDIEGGMLRKQSFDVSKLELSTVLRTTLEREEYCEFRNLQAYSFNEKVFAISGGCVIVHISILKSTKGNKTLRVKDYMSGYTQYTFYDEDGDGKFERRYNSSPGNKDFNILIPAWVKK